MMDNRALIYSYNNCHQETQTGFSKIHANFSKKEKEVKTGADIITADYLVERLREGKAYPLWNAKFKNVPLSALVSYEAGHWFSEVAWLDLIGEGESPQIAIEDLERQIDYFISYYSNESQENLVGFALELRDRFLKITR